MSDDMSQEVMAIFREEAVDLVQRMLAALNRAANSQGPDQAKQINEVSRLLHTLKGAAAAVDAEDIKNRAHVLEDRVAALGKNPDRSRFDALFTEVEIIEAQLSDTPQAVPSLPVLSHPREPAPNVQPKHEAHARPTVEPTVADAHLATEWLRVAPERVDQLHAQLGELVLTRLQQGQLVDRMVRLRTTAALAMKREREMSRALLEARTQLAPETWRRLREHTQSTSGGWNSLLENLQTVCREARVLQTQSAIVSQTVEESIQGLRLMPLAPFFESYARTVRDAARRASRQVRFQVKADGTEVDRSVLTRLSDALLHLVRNAVVHGLEAPEVRVAKGKPAEGALVLEAWSVGTHAMIRVVDDGAGVDEAKVRSKARALGIEESEDVLDILTHPGFTTREAADDLAGRGVGLDVVHGTVRSLQGSLELHSEPGRGCAFTIRVPIAASTTMGLVLEVGKHRFGVMLSDVERVLRPRPDEIGQVEGRPAVRVGEEMVALASLAELLGVESEEQHHERIPVVVIRHARNRLALAVDEIPGEHALVVRPFGVAYRRAELFLGGAVQPDHSVVPVVSTPALFARATRVPAAALQRKLRAERPRAASNLHALVVDDSITMRTLLRNVLQAAGYHVTVAEDGKAALSLLEEMRQCHIIVTDLQMPHMDGIELCRNVRARAGSYVPLVMVTSVDEDEEKSRALAAGADAYVVKSTFEQTAFLKRVDMLVRGPS